MASNPKYPAIALSTRHYDRKPGAFLSAVIAALRTHGADGADIRRLEHAFDGGCSHGDDAAQPFHGYDLTNDFDKLVDDMRTYIVILHDA